MKETITLILLILGIITVWGALVYGAWLIHPVLGVLITGFFILAVAEAIIKNSK